MNFFSSEKLTDNVTRIHAIGGEQLYLITGTQKAVLIDSGSGVGDLLHYVRNFTNLPLLVLLTHNHIDHALGTIQFDNVYLSPKDIETFDPQKANTERQLYLADCPLYNKIKATDYQPIDNPKRFHPLHHGDTFDLGGQTITAFECPGHSLGSFVFLLNEARILITGDAISHFTLMFGNNCCGIKTYLHSLKLLNQQTKGLYDQLFLSHDDLTPPLNMIDQVIELCHEIILGTDDKVPFGYMNHQGFIAKKCGNVPDCIYGHSTHNRFDGGFGNLVYSPEKILQ